MILKSNYYYVKFEKPIMYSIGPYNERNYLTHREKIKKICTYLDLQFPGYRGGEIVIFSALPKPKKIYRIKFSEEEIEKIEENDNYKGKLIYVTNPFMF